MKTIYEAPSIEITLILPKDIITVSGTTDDYKNDNFEDVTNSWFD